MESGIILGLVVAVGHRTSGTGGHGGSVARCAIGVDEISQGSSKEQ